MKLVVRCPAKVNLHLEVLGRRSDGYHELRTLFAAVGIRDELEIEDASPGTLDLAVEPAGAAPVGADNLVLRAARALQRRYRSDRGARLRLRKRIPVAGGMGGGSSDCAAALVGLAALWRLPARLTDLHVLAATLGADVPFFLVGGVAWGRGRGTDLDPAQDLAPCWVTVLPGVEQVPTAEVYRRLAAGPVGDDIGSAVYHWVVAGGQLPYRDCRNDLEPTVIAGWPEVGARLAELRKTQPALALVSGSGGTVFGLYEDETAARRAADDLVRHRPVVAPVLTRTASRLEPSRVEG